MLKPLLILDLDETLIYGSLKKLDRDSDFDVGPFMIYERPDLYYFLKTVSVFFDLAIWSSGTDDYVYGISFYLRKYFSEWKFIWGRKKCVAKMNFDTYETDYIKDLKIIKRFGFDLNRVLIVDDTPIKVSRNYGNAIYVKPFFGEKDDTELQSLVIYLKHLLDFSDFRKVEKRGWRSKVLSLKD